MSQRDLFTLGIDIGSTTVKIAVLDEKMSCYSQITNDISQTFRKPFLICLEEPSTSSGRSTPPR